MVSLNEREKLIAGSLRRPRRDRGTGYRVAAKTPLRQNPSGQRLRQDMSSKEVGALIRYLYLHF